MGILERWGYAKYSGGREIRVTERFKKKMGNTGNPKKFEDSGKWETSFYGENNKNLVASRTP